MSTNRVSHPGQPIRRDTLPEPSPYGFMEPANSPVITRRMATPAELAIVAARDEALGYLGAPAPLGREVTPPKGFGMREGAATDASRKRGAAQTHRPGKSLSAADIAKRDIRAVLVMEAMARHGNDAAAVCIELGMRPSALAMVVKHARLREVA